MNRATRFGAGGLALAAACGITVLIPALASGGAGTAVGSGKQAATVYVATLSGANEVPTADPDGEGAAAVTIDPATGEILRGHPRRQHRPGDPGPHPPWRRRGQRSGRRPVDDPAAEPDLGAVRDG